MYQVNCSIVGISPLLQNRFATPDLENVFQGGKKQTGATDYSSEWKQKFYQKGGIIHQPANHIERALIKAATDFKIQGRRGKTYKDLFSAAVFVTPELISFGIPVLEFATDDPDCDVYLDARPVVIQRARIVRLRPALKAGWKLNFDIQVIDDQLPQSVLNDALTLAGKAIGIGDFRPRFGRFMIEKFELLK